MLIPFMVIFACPVVQNISLKTRFAKLFLLIDNAIKVNFKLLINMYLSTATGQFITQINQ